MVFQSYALFLHLNVAENIMFCLRAHRVAAPKRVRRLKRAVEILDIAHLLQRKPGQLSGCQQQRVALASNRGRSAGLADGSDCATSSG